MKSATNRDVIGRWKKRLLKIQIPVSGAEHEELLRKVTSPDCTVQALTPLFEHSPTLSMALISEVNSLNLPADPVIEPEHALALLGLDRVESLLRRQQKGVTDTASAPFLRTLTNSMLAASIARMISTKLRLANARNAYWGGLFYNAPRWYMAISEPEKYSSLFPEPANLPFPSFHQLELQQLQVTAADIRTKLGKLSALPGLSTEQTQAKQAAETSPVWLKQARVPCLDKLSPHNKSRLTARYYSSIEESAELRMLASQSSGAIVLANLLVDELDLCYYSKYSHRLLRLTAAWLKQSIEQTWREIFQLALSVDRGLINWYGKGPAQRLFSFWPGMPIYKPDSSPQPQPQARPIEPVKVGRNIELFRKIHHRLSHEADNIKSVKELLQLLLQGLHSGLGCERVAILLLNRQQQQLESKLVVTDGPPFQLKIPLQYSPIFKKFLEKPSELWLKPGQNTEIWSRLPGPFKAATGEVECLLRSLFAGNKAIAIVYADRAFSSKKLRQQEFSFFQILMKDAEKALKQLHSSSSHKN